MGSVCQADPLRFGIRLSSPGVSSNVPKGSLFCLNYPIRHSDPVSMITKERLPSLQGGPRLRAIYSATLVLPTSMPSLRSSPWILGARHNGLKTLISRISRRISNNTVADLKPAPCQRTTYRVGRLQVHHTSWERASVIGDDRRKPCAQYHLAMISFDPFRRFLATIENLRCCSRDTSNTH